MTAVADLNKRRHDLREAARANLREYIVTYVFLALSVLFVIFSGRPLSDIFSQLMAACRATCSSCWR